MLVAMRLETRPARRRSSALASPREAAKLQRKTRASLGGAPSVSERRLIELRWRNPQPLGAASFRRVQGGAKCRNLLVRKDPPATFEEPIVAGAGVEAQPPEGIAHPPVTGRVSEVDSSHQR
jgi:hypothetical protein